MSVSFAGPLETRPFPTWASMLNLIYVLVKQYRTSTRKLDPSRHAFQGHLRSSNMTQIDRLQIAQKLNIFNQRCLRRILHRDHDVTTKKSCWELADTVTERRFHLAGHIPSKVAMSWTPDDGRRRRGRTKKTWRRTFQEDLTRTKISWEKTERTAMDRPLWHQAAAHCAWHGRN